MKENTKNTKMLILGQNIRETRISLNLTQDQFSEKLNITPNHLSKIENGNVGITVDTIINVCEIANCSPINLFKGIIETSSIMDKYELLNSNNKVTVEILIAHLLDTQQSD